jgi:xanthosine utilization system XapX-like protein
MIENRYLRLLVALVAGIVMGLVSSYMSARATAAPLRPHIVHSVVVPAGAWR